MNKLKILFVGYIVTLLGLFLYSFTQVDLNLTLFRSAVAQEIIKSFQYIGYFNRPLSTELYLIIIVVLFGFYITFLRLAAMKKLEKKFVWKIIITATVLLTLSYNALSYDLFNYIFDAKIITHYHANPYLHKALDYSGDPMLMFMRWTHRVYPYGPVWLGLTVPISFLGLQYFISTFILFKLLMAGSFVGSVYFIGKILQRISPEKELFGIVFFALNPLVLIESVVSAHLDIVMMFFILWSFYLFIEKRYVFSYLTFLLSVGVKFVTGLLLPVLLTITYLQKGQKKIHWDKVFIAILLVLIFGVMFEIKQSGNFQPWYLIVPLAFAAFVAYRYFILIPAVIISFAALLNYVPFLHEGNWNKPIPQIISDINFLSYCLAFCVISLYFLYKQIIFARKVRRVVSHKK